MTFPKSLAFLLALLFLATAPPASAEEGADFVVIQPGQPGTTHEAQPVMDALASYLGENLGVPVQGRYFNDDAEGLKWIRQMEPAWGIVGLGFFASHYGNPEMAPLASTRPASLDKDEWRLMVPADGPDDWRKVAGEVQGTMFHNRRAGACFLFHAAPDELPFDLKGTSRPFRAVRKVLNKKLGGLVMDAVQHKAFLEMPEPDKLKAVQSSGSLPNSPVVWFGEPGRQAKALSRVLSNMKNDPSAADILNLLRTSGFGPADPSLRDFILEGAHGTCPR